MAENGLRAFQRAKMSPQDTQLNTIMCIFLPKIKLNTVKPVLSSHTKRPKIGFQDQISLNAGQKYCRMLQGEHSAILSTFIKLPFFIKIFFLSILSGPYKTGFAITENLIPAASSCTHMRICVHIGMPLATDNKYKVSLLFLHIK